MGMWFDSTVAVRETLQQSWRALHSSSLSKKTAFQQTLKWWMVAGKLLNLDHCFVYKPT